jgi:uncharacterized SAM-binding protein YcdF (DUF218 family)
VPAGTVTAGRVAVRAVKVLAGLAALYLVATFVQVWWASRWDDRGPAEAIVVLGAAQYDGTPSPVLERRLEHGLELWQDGVAPVIVVTGGGQPGDRVTEAFAGADFLLRLGVPDSAIRREVDGRSSFESLAAAARFLRDEGREHVVLVSDPYHSARLLAIAREVGLDAVVSPTPGGSASATQLARESLAVAAGRVFGHRRLSHWLA